MIKWLYERYLFTISFVIWGITLFTLVTLQVFGFFGEVPDIPASTATAYGALFGIPAITGIVKLRKNLNLGKVKDDIKNSVGNNNS